jgi:hypothetical protein
MHIWTDAPLAEVWQQLRYFARAANVRQLLRGQTSSRRSEAWSTDESSTSAHEIASCLEQADEYIHASRVVGLATRPLLQFYSVEALAKAMILASDRTIHLHDLRYHGLSTRATTAAEPVREGLQRYADATAAWAVEQEFAVTNLGVFPHLARVAGDGEIRAGFVIRLRELVRTMPDLAQLYERHYGEPSHCLRLYDWLGAESGKPFTIHFIVRDESRVTGVFPEFNEGFEPDRRHEHAGFRALASDAPIPSFGRVTQ